MVKNLYLIHTLSIMNCWEEREKLKELDSDALISLLDQPDEETRVWVIIELGNRKEVRDCKTNECYLSHAW